MSDAKHPETSQEDAAPPRQYWQSLAQRAGQPEPSSENEFSEELPVGPVREADALDRRSFFKMMGLSATAALAACQRAPVKKAIPFVKKPEEVTPGVALWYASTCGGCSAGCGLLLKTRDGRPIKVEGNDEHPLTGGGVCATGQASVLSLYDSSRARAPSAGGKEIGWAELDQAVKDGLQRLGSAGKAIRLVLPWTIGPSAEAAVARFLSTYPTARTVRYEAAGNREAIAAAHQITHGARAIPQYRFDSAKVVVSVGADFLGTWLSPVVFARQHARARQVDRRAMSRHFQVEATMSLTGSNADRRFIAAPSGYGATLAALAGRLLDRASPPGSEGLRAALAAAGASELPAAALDEMANALWEARGAALVVAESNDPAVQALANVANALLDSYGATLSLARGTPLDAGAVGFDAFLGELRRGEVGAVVLVGSNPVYSHPAGAELDKLLRSVELTVSCADRLDETAAPTGYLAPEHSFFEDWGDAEPQKGLLGLRQPAVAPLFSTRSAFESLLAWSGAHQAWYDFVRGRWEQEVYPAAGASALTFQSFWDQAVQRGFAELAGPTGEESAFQIEAAPGALQGMAPPAGGDELELVLYPKVSLGDGRYANNGWLQELPDPISKATWGNYLCVAPARAATLGIEDGRVVTVTVGEQSVSLPALVQPGLHPRVVAAAVGYGRTAAGNVGNKVGANVFPLAAQANGRVALSRGGARLVATGENKPLALSQTYSRLDGRPHIQETTLAAILKGGHGKSEHAEPAKGEHGEPAQGEHGAKGGHHSVSMWSGHAYTGHRWGLVVDLAACTGCSACVVSCNAENNVSVVGEVEVRRRRDMHWLRLDRYYTGPDDNPEVLHQPMMCQHCENAPCETVCPVLATVHSSEGLNQQVYNRCVGTRYCANNCPPKVRRFNWFEYRHDDPLERMVLNPDVAVRSRGVMEKCSMCVQRIEEVKALARREKRPLKDGEIRTACQQSCPSQAIHFGDLNDPQSTVAKLAGGERSYKVLEEINVGPVVSYLTKVRNPGGEHG